MKIKSLTLALAATLSAPAFAADQYLVRVPANVNLSAAAPETPQEPISLSLSAEALPAATVNEPYSFNLLDRLTITGGSGSHNYSDTAWSLKTGDALPPGLSLSGSMIAGTPTAKNEAGTSFEVTGTYQDASGKQVYTIVVGGQVLRVTQISAGGNHTCAVTTSGAAKCWGRGDYGQLGDGGTNTNQPTPVDVSGLTSGVASISTGTLHTCAVTTSGAAKCWGYNYYGQLGDGGTNTSQPTPVDVSGLTSGVSSISAGDNHTCAVTTSGAAKCWGYSANGQLGNGSTVNSPRPVSVIGLDSGVTQIAAGQSHTCSVHAGAAKCWGYGGDGRLGNGGTSNHATPVSVTGLGSGVTQITVGYIHTCAVHDGAAKCWGGGANGRLGNGSTMQRTTPVSVTGLGSGVTQISAGVTHTCAVHGGAAKCWGTGANGRLGNGSTTESTTPVAVTGLDSGVMHISAGQSHACAVTTSGAAKCWGNGSNGRLGDGTTASRTTPVDVLP